MDTKDKLTSGACWLLWLVCACFVIFSFTSCASREVAAVAKRQVGSHFAKGQQYQCGNFVAHCVQKAGKELPSNPALALNWLSWGRPVPWALKQPGDVIVAWRGSKCSESGHVLIYVGGNKAVHRSNYKSPVGLVDISNYQHRVLGVRRG